MTDFKVGDVVTFAMGWDAWNGGRGIVKGDSEWGTGHYLVEVLEVPKANGSVRVGHTTDFKAEWLQLVTPATKFHVGDWVEITGFNRGWDGTVKQIAKLPEGGSPYYKLSDGGAQFSDKYLKAAEDPSQTKPEAVDGPLKIYLAGPMSGIEHYNFPAFFTAARKLRKAGHTVFNPAENDLATGFNALGMEGHEAADHGFSLREALKTDLSWICENADALVLLEGWEGSKGVRAEMALAEALGLPKYEMANLPVEVAK